MNWVVLAVSVACLARWSDCVVPAYSQYDLPQRQTLGGGYQGPPVVPVILPGGFIADTEEVARAKDLHFNAFAQAANKVQYSPSREYSQPKYTAVTSPVRQQYTQQIQPQRQQDYNVPQHQYTGPATRAYSALVKPVYQPQQQPAQLAYSPQQRYQGPPVIPVVLPSGYIAETADVEAAKQHHFELVAQAQAAVARAQERDSKKYGYTGTGSSGAYTHQRQGEYDDGSQYDDSEQDYNQVYQAAPRPASYRGANPSASQRQSSQGPPAVPVVLPSGHIADTAEVAAAKISHLQQLLDAAQKSLPQQRYYANR